MDYPALCLSVTSYNASSISSSSSLIAICPSFTQPNDHTRLLQTYLACPSTIPRPSCHPPADQHLILTAVPAPTSSLFLTLNPPFTIRPIRLRFYSPPFLPVLHHRHPHHRHPHPTRSVPPSLLTSAVSDRRVQNADTEMLRSSGSMRGCAASVHR